MTECGFAPEGRCQFFEGVSAGALCLFEFAAQLFDPRRISFGTPSLEMRQGDQGLTEDTHFGAKSLW